MGMSKSDWMAVAEAEAAAQYGRKYAKAFAFRRFGLVPLCVLVAVGALGWIAYQGWLFVSTAFGSGIDLPLVAVAGVLLVLTTVAYRPGRMPSTPAMLVVKAVVFAAAWLLLIAFAIGSSV